MNKFIDNWNGGKIESMFKFEKNKYINNFKFTSDEAKNAFYYGKWYLKVHGSCCAIDLETGTPYQRVNLPNKQIPKNNIQLEKGAQPSILFKNGKCTHNYYWKPFKNPTEATKKERKLLDKVWEKSINFIQNNKINDKK